MHDIHVGVKHSVMSVGNSNSIFLLPFVIIWFKNCRSAANGSLNVLKLFVCKLGSFSW